MATNTADALPAKQSKGFLGTVERIGNKIPNPIILFLYLILFVIVLSHVLYLFGISVTQEIAVPAAPEAEMYYLDSALPAVEPLPEDYTEDDFVIETQTVAARSLLTAEGIRFIFTSFVPNFAGFTVVAVILVAMLGVGVAEEAGMMGALIRKLVQVAPRRLITFIIILVGVLTSVATDAGYLILIPLAASAFVALKRHPIVGIAAAFAGVSAIFAVNILIAPLDGMLTEITNEAIQLVRPGATISVTANLYFNIASTLLMALVCTFITERMIAPRFGAWDPAEGAESEQEAQPANAVSPEAEARGLRYALWGFLAVAVVVALLALIPGAPLARPQGDASASSPFLDSIIFIITLLFLAAGIGYGWGANTLKGSKAIIGAITKTFAAQAFLIFLLLIISQFIAHFNYTNMPQLVAIGMADLLERANIGAVPLLVALVLVIVLLDLIIPNSIPKWAIFAPIFVPLFIQLGVEPQTVLAAYRIGDSPANVITPLMVYFPFIVLVAQRYDKKAGIGSIIAMMLPYMAIVLVAWIVLLVLWFVLGIPLGPGYPVAL
jgi:aminobenzoyl-glutamate transport protein